MPVTDGCTASQGLPRAMARSMVKLPTSWQRPTVLMEVSRQTERVRQVIGLVMLKSQASGQCSSMALPMPTRTGMLRRARLMPPGPTVSPTVWVMPWAAGTSRSTAMERNPPVEMQTMTKSAPSRARPRSVVVLTVALASMRVVDLVGQRLHFGQRGGIDVLEHEVHAGQGRGAEEVGHEFRSPTGNCRLRRWSPGSRRPSSSRHRRQSMAARPGLPVRRGQPREPDSRPNIIVAPARAPRYSPPHAHRCGEKPRSPWPPPSPPAAACTWCDPSPSRRSCPGPSRRSTTPT